MKYIFLLILIINLSFAKQYSIVVMSTKRFDKNAASKFIKKFPNGIVKKYTKFVEYKIEPFNSYKEAKKYLKKVRKYYKSAFIINYNPNIGKVIYFSQSNNKNITKKSKNIVKNKTILGKKNKIIYCKNNCEKTLYIDEYNLTKIKNSLYVNIPNYLKDINFTENKQISLIKKGCLNNSYSNLMFYIDFYGNIYSGQKKDNKYLKGNNENIKLGLIYEKYFFDYWKFYLDTRLIYSRKNYQNNILNNFYLDINELYIRSYCLNDFFDILIGRKKIKDYKSWWYDNYIDQISIFNENSLLTTKLLLGTRINNNILTDENSNKLNIKKFLYFIIHSDYEYYFNKHIGFILLYERKKPNDINLLNEKNKFIGIYLNGKKNSFKYWLNTSFSNSSNEDNKQTKNGFGFDLGTIYYKLDKFFGIGYANGSEKFRQPYIATNYSDFFVNNFSYKYYGFLLNPMLENIQIISLYSGKYLDNFEQIIFSIHNYKQNKVEIKNYNDTYMFNTNGKSKNVGNELDIVYQYLLPKKRKFKVGVSYFIGGDAFESLNKKNIIRMYMNFRYYWK